MGINYYTQQVNYTTKGDVEASNDIRVGVFTGIDFYVYKGLYVGAELGLKLIDKLPADQKHITKTNREETETIYERDGHAFAISTYVAPTFRLGWTF